MTRCARIMATSVIKLTLLLSAVPTARAAPAATFEAARLAQDTLAPSFPIELDRYIARAVADWDLPGVAIAIVRNDSTLVAKGYGVRELGKPQPVDENTVFD